MTKKRGGPRRRPRKNTAFTRMLEDAIRRIFGTQRELAEKMGLSAPHISRVMSGEDSLGLDQCLKLALLTGLDPEEVWSAVGQHDFVEDIRKVYGPAQRPVVVTNPQTPEERELLTAVSRLKPDDREFVVRLIKGDAQHGTRKR